MKERQSWRDLVESYFQAYCDSEGERRRDESAAWESRFLADNGTADMQQQHAVWWQKYLARAPIPIESDTITVVNETVEQVTIDIVREIGSKGIDQFPYFTTRLVLQNSGSVWQIESILRPCIACNHAYGQQVTRVGAPGKCFACRGSGCSITGIQMRGIWPFRSANKATGVCTFCDGTGTCKDCAETATPGWRVLATVTAMG
jgi:hypothetical protein